MKKWQVKEEKDLTQNFEKEIQCQLGLPNWQNIKSYSYHKYYYFININDIHEYDKDKSLDTLIKSAINNNYYDLSIDNIWYSRWFADIKTKMTKQQIKDEIYRKNLNAFKITWDWHQNEIKFYINRWVNENLVYRGV